MQLRIRTMASCECSLLLHLFACHRAHWVKGLPCSASWASLSSGRGLLRCLGLWRKGAGGHGCQTEISQNATTYRSEIVTCNHLSSNAAAGCQQYDWLESILPPACSWRPRHAAQMQSYAPSQGRASAASANCLQAQERVCALSSLLHVGRWDTPTAKLDMQQLIGFKKR